MKEPFVPGTSETYRTSRENPDLVLLSLQTAPASWQATTQSQDPGCHCRETLSKL